MDRNVDITLVEKYCMDDALCASRKLIEKKQSKKFWRCGGCHKALKDGSDSIACEMCLLRYHFECVGLHGTPEGDWFCQKCISCVTEGNTLEYLKMFAKYYNLYTVKLLTSRHLLVWSKLSAIRTYPHFWSLVRISNF